MSTTTEPTVRRTSWFGTPRRGAGALGLRVLPGVLLRLLGGGRGVVVGLAGVCVLLVGLGFFAARALALAPLEVPEVSVASPVRSGEATFLGTLNPQASEPVEEGTYTFEYNEGASCTGGSSTTPGIALGAFPEPLPGETVTGLAADSEYTVCLSEMNLADTSTVQSTPVRFFTGPPEAPQTQPAGEVGSTAAKLRGVLNPNKPGNPGSYRFIYREGGSECEGEGQRTSAAEGMSGGQAQAVEVEVSELLPGSEYAFCVSATDEAGETTTSPSATFTTETVAPTIEAESVGSSEETPTSALLTARVIPGGSTSYRFEYGTSSAYGQSTPAGTLSAEGSAARALPLSAQITGLSPGSEYHWRLVVENSAGREASVDHTLIYLAGAPNDTPPGSCPDERARQERSSTRLPDCRAYMMVTPTEKNGAIIGNPAFGPGFPQISDNGQRMIARSAQCFGQAPSCIANRGKREGSLVEFERTPTGWVTRSLNPPADQLETYTAFVVNANDGTAVFGAPVHTTIPTGVFGVQEVLYGRMEDGELVRIGPLEEEGHHIGSYRALTLEAPVIATADLSHVVYFAQVPLWAFDPTDGGSGEAHTLYEYAGTGQTHPLLVGVRGAYGSDRPVSFCATEYDVERIKPGGMSLVDPMSESGRTVFFTAQGHRENGNCGSAAPAADQVWARVDGETPGRARKPRIRCWSPVRRRAPRACRAKGAPPRRVSNTRARPMKRRSRGTRTSKELRATGGWRCSLANSS